MHKFGTIYIICLSFILFVIIFILGNFIFENHEKFNKEKTLNAEFTVNQEENIDKKEENKKQNNLEINDWYVEIPKIDLKAPIIEGIAEKNLNKYVGHFEETSKKEGTIGLART